MVDRIPFPTKETVASRLSDLQHRPRNVVGDDRAGTTEAVVRRRFNAEATVAAIAEQKATMLVAVPTMLHRMIELGPEILGGDTSSLKVVVIAGSALSPGRATVSRMRSAMSSTACGSTEVAVATVATPAELRKAPGTAGRSPITCGVVLFDGEGKRGLAFQGQPNLRPQRSPFQGSQRQAELDHRRLHVQRRRRPFRRRRIAVRRRARRRHDRRPGARTSSRSKSRTCSPNARMSTTSPWSASTTQNSENACARSSLPLPDAKRDVDEIKLYVRDNLARYKVPRDVVFLDELPPTPPANSCAGYWSTWRFSAPSAAAESSDIR